MRAARLLVGFIFCLFLGLAVVRAQEPTPSDAPAQTSVLDLITRQYFASVEKYRGDEQKFVIARETYYQLNTLASQDEAIRRGKDVMLSRSELLNTYFTYLHLTMLQTRGVEIGDKERVLNQIASILGEFSVYQDKIPSLSDRDDVHQHLLAFNLRQRDYLTGAYGALEVIKIGEMQTAIDTAALLRGDLEGWVAEANISAADRAIKQRGLQEAQRLLTQARTDLSKILADQRNQAKASVTASSYRTFQAAMDPVYIQLRQAESFLKEIAKGI